MKHLPLTCEMSELVTSHIELFPDELWLEFLAYTSPLDLYYAWRNLNTRINGILQSVRIGIVIKNKNNDGKSYQKIIDYFSSQIVHVKDQSPSLNCSIDFLPLINIRSLDLARCSKENLEQLTNHHRLTRLSLPCNLSSDFFSRFVLGTDGEKRYPHLRSIGRILYFHVQNKDLSSLSLRTESSSTYILSLHQAVILLTFHNISQISIALPLITWAMRVFTHGLVLSEPKFIVIRMMD